MPTATRDVTVGALTTGISVARTASGPVAVGLRHGGLRGQLLGRDRTGARVALLAAQALLLGGDQVRLDVRVGAGCRLEITEPAGTVAYATDEAAAGWHTTIDVEPGGLLVWHTAPFVVSEQARVHRSTTVLLAPDAGCLLRETLVLGRSGEGPGRLTTTTYAARHGSPVLVETLDLGPVSQVPGMLGANRVLDQVTDLRPGRVSDDPAAFNLAAGGVVHRRLAPAAHLASLESTWQELVRSSAAAD
ncbi:urease accessory protein UreD [Nocardioides houyundeii]|uniref:urease accessory protein UreD n=1 Tax=Nocardioides houyundeii TaxID=2045452 RepID=UPI000C773761|nr:urease accessory protein UreD [Nocardioides houyundeii]